MFSFHAATAFYLTALTVSAFAQHGAMPRGMSHEDHLKMLSRDAEMKQRGNVAMGFDQDKTTHHFRLTPTGGVIDVAVNETADAASRNQVREHLRAVSKEFGAGIFTSPVATHAEVPPGVPVMRERKARITYIYEETPGGAQVVMNAKDKSARAALHDFLRYQIREHKTGDPEK